MDSDIQTKQGSKQKIYYTYYKTFVKSIRSQLKG
jgi:hypothetical protein